MIRIAIQNKGRLSEASEEYLQKCGLIFSSNGRKLVNRCVNTEVELIYLRTADIPEYVSRGVADFGIIGQNTLKEKGKTADIIQSLGFASCRLVIAVPDSSTIKTIKDLEGERIATAYPNLLEAFLRKKGVSVAIIPLSGSVEIAPPLGLADAICDLVQTGETLKENGLVELETIMDSQAVLIQTSVKRLKKTKQMEILKRLIVNLPPLS